MYNKTAYRLKIIHQLCNTNAKKILVLGYDKRSKQNIISAFVVISIGRIVVFIIIWAIRRYLQLFISIQRLC